MRAEIQGTESWDGYQSIHRALHFQGLTVEVVTFSNDADRYHPSVVSITGAQWALSSLRVGQPAQAPLRRLGVVGPVANGMWRFEGETDTLLVETRRGAVRAITYVCYTG